MNSIESPEQQERPESGQVESQAEKKDLLISGAEMLEEPPDGSFLHGLQLFIAWVKNLVSDDKKN